MKENNQIVMMNSSIERSAASKELLKADLAAELERIHFVPVDEEHYNSLSIFNYPTEGEVLKLELISESLPDGVHSYIRIMKGKYDKSIPSN